MIDRDLGPDYHRKHVQDLLTERWNQPAGRGLIGIVTGFDHDYRVMAVMVDFGRDYSVGMAFPELGPIQIVPEPSTLVLLAQSTLLVCSPVQALVPPAAASR